MADDRKIDKSWLDRIRSMFTDEVIIRKQDGKIKVVDFEERQQTNINLLKDRFIRLHKNYEYNAADMSMAYQYNRHRLFRDYDAMDADSIIASALDIMADESTTKNEFGQVLMIESNDEDIKERLHNLFYDVMNIEFNLWPWTRNLVKYGDQFLALEIAKDLGIINVHPQSVYYTERIDGYDPLNPSIVKFKVENDPLGKMEYDNFEMAHFRLLADTNFLPYGKSMLENARRIWKQLTLMEDAMLIHRIMRAPEKRVFKIDIGGINPTEIDNYMRKIMDKMKKVPFVDKQTGDYNLKYNMQNLTEDFYLPVRGGDSGTSIENLAGLDYSAIEDIEYLQKRLFAALKVPKAYLSYEEDLSGKATLAAHDVRFARTIERIQRIMESELSKIAIVHLYAQGIEDERLTDFDLTLTNSSTIYEQEKINLWASKVSLARDMKDIKMVSNDFIYKNILNIGESESETERGKIVKDLIQQFRFTAIENEGNDPAAEAEKKPMDVEGELEEIKQKIKDERNKPNDGNGGGRPKDSSSYRKDRHPLGRDPLGDVENHRKSSRVQEATSKQQILKFLKNRSSKKTILNEDNLIEDTDL
jgi:hypothetical protein